MSLRISASLFGVPPPACPGHPPSGRRALDKDAMGGNHLRRVVKAEWT